MFDTVNNTLVFFQVVDYSARKSVDVTVIEKWLNSVLAYDP